MAAFDCWCVEFVVEIIWRQLLLKDLNQFLRTFLASQSKRKMEGGGSVHVEGHQWNWSVCEPSSGWRRHALCDEVRRREGCLVGGSVTTRLDVDRRRDIMLHTILKGTPSTYPILGSTLKVLPSAVIGIAQYGSNDVYNNV